MVLLEYRAHVARVMLTGQRKLLVYKSIILATQYFLTLCFKLVNMLSLLTN